MTVMFSFGSNLNLAQMKRRCPAAIPLGRLCLSGWRLVFRGVADAIPEDGAVCYGGVWRITSACELALDAYEGVDRGLYDKTYIPIKKTPHGETEMLIYTMNSTGIFPPSQYYLEVIREGYRNFRMPRKAYNALKRAVRESYDDKAPTHRERRRHRRNGRPPLALRPKTSTESRRATSWEMAAVLQKVGNDGDDGNTDQRAVTACIKQGWLDRVDASLVLTDAGRAALLASAPQKRARDPYAKMFDGIGDNRAMPATRTDNHAGLGDHS